MSSSSYDVVAIKFAYVNFVVCKKEYKKSTVYE